LLVQVDSVDVRNQYDQAAAALEAARARAEVSAAQKKRSDGLYAQQILNVEEHEAAMLDDANAKAALVGARASLDIARQRLADATVRAPIAGTILAQPVSLGQVISSATSNVSGGTTLLQMADLGRVRIRALVSETDIGNVRPGEPATVAVDAFPQRQFRGEVEKVEPQSVVQQSVTMFPVLVSISNEDGRLLPGMNGEVTILVQQRENVPSVSLDAVRSVREITAVAAALGVDVDSVRARVQAQLVNRGGGPGAGRGATGGSSAAPVANGGSNGSGHQVQVVFVKTAGGLEPRVVHLGVSNLDYAEVLSGVGEGDEVALLSVAELQARRTANLSELRQRMSSGMPGVGGSTGRSSARRAGP
jgi:HlyD family secretion protein